MRLHRLEVEGVGPFRTRQVIDFDLVGAQGLFLIDGPTGAGKTTIIDAIVYALFGRVSAADSDETRMRSNFLDDDEKSSIVCEFSVDGIRHRIERTLPYTRAPRRGAGKPVTTPEKRQLTTFDASGTVVLELVKEREIGDHLQQVLGLDADQFRKLVVLPQGEFSALLRMVPTERSKVLEPLLGDGLYRRIQESLESQGARAKQARVEADRSVLSAAQRLSGALEAYRECDGFPDDAALNDVGASEEERIAVAELAAQWLDEELARAKGNREAEEAALQTLRRRLESVAAALDSLVSVATARDELRSARDGVDQTDAQLEPAEVKGTLAALERAIGGMTEFVRWEAGESERAAQRLVLVEAVERATSARESGELALQQLPAQIEAAERHLNELRAQAQQLPALELRLSKLREQRNRFIDLGKQRVEKAQLATRLATVQSEHDQATSTLHRLREEFDTLISRQRLERAAMLAALLQDGAPCPVCGSPEHPVPARAAGADDVVSDADVDSARDELASAQASLGKLDASLADVRNLHGVAQSRVADLEAQLTSLDEDAVHQSIGDVEKDMGEARRAEQALAKAEQSLRDLQARERSSGEQLRALGEALTTATVTLSTFDHDDTAMRERIREQFGEGVSPSAFVQQAEARLQALRRLERAHEDLRVAEASMTEEVRGLDVEQVRTQHAQTKQEFAVVDRRHAEAAERVAQLSGSVQALVPLRAALDGAISAKSTALEATAEAIALGELAAGGGGNRRKLPLRAYALQLRFRSVLDAASRHLERMSSGKFSFELKEESRQGYSGLGIWIRDAWSGGLREPKTLSGGETFYASLSLALGLAEVVQAEAGGRMLETLFVDEGFGSLDADTLDTVLDQLDRLRSGGRVVGVVSHVSEMKDAISDRVDVRVQPDRTSAITMVC